MVKEPESPHLNSSFDLAALPILAPKIYCPFDIRSFRNVVHPIKNFGEGGKDEPPSWGHSLHPTHVALVVFLNFNISKS
jgi:hypothetical protein